MPASTSNPRAIPRGPVPIPVGLHDGDDRSRPAAANLESSAARCGAARRDRSTPTRHPPAPRPAASPLRMNSTPRSPSPRGKLPNPRPARRPQVRSGTFQLIARVVARPSRRASVAASVGSSKPVACGPIGCPTPGAEPECLQESMPSEPVSQTPRPSIEVEVNGDPQTLAGGRRAWRRLAGRSWGLAASAWRSPSIGMSSSAAAIPPMFYADGDRVEILEAVGGG